MTNCLNSIKNFVLSMFTQDESVGLRSLEKTKLVVPAQSRKKDGEFKFSDIMK